MKNRRMSNDEILHQRLSEFEEQKWIREKYPEVFCRFVRDVKEHEAACNNDSYYSYSCGGGMVPVPCCKYCMEYDGDRCMKEWNNADPCYYIDWRDDKEPGDLCEAYRWNGEWWEDD